MYMHMNINITAQKSTQHTTKINLQGEKG